LSLETLALQGQPDRRARRGLRALQGLLVPQEQRVRRVLRGIPATRALQGLRDRLALLALLAQLRL
jgi:hypothetical protein